MKKLISIILATAIILSLVPAIFASAETDDGITVWYKISEELREEYDVNSAPGNALIKNLTKGETNGFFEVASIPEGEKLNDNSYIRLRCYGKKPNDVTSFQVMNGKAISFNVYVPVSDTYKMQMIHTTYPTADNVPAYINVTTVDDRSFGFYNCTKAGSSTFRDYTTSDLPNAIYLEKGLNKITFTSASNNATVGSFKLYTGSKPGTGDALMPCFNGDITLEGGETATLKGFLSSTATTATVEYASSNDCVTVALDGTITAVKPGKATVTMTASDSTVVTANPYTVEITVPGKETSFVSVAIDDDGDGTASITAADLGKNVTATANVPVGKVFRGWVRGSAENGRLVSAENPYTFTAMTNIYLTAVYTDAPTEETDEYYNWDGQFLGNTKPDSVPSLVGYTFAQTWTRAKKEGLITSWIANFAKTNTEYKITGNTDFTMSKADDKYDTEVTCTSTSGNAVYWCRDGKIIDYGTSYKFFIWGDTAVTTSDKGHNGAKLMLDVKKDDSYMVEYDAGNTTLLEVGILFGDDGETPTVESCKEKMSSQRNLNEKGHGQFSATADKYPVARGYLIYQDGDTYRVIYAD